MTKHFTNKNKIQKTSNRKGKYQSTEVIPEIIPTQSLKMEQ